MLQLLAAVATTALLSLSTQNAKPGDDFTALVKVVGAFTGPVCVLVGEDEKQIVVGQVCSPDDVDVKEGESKEVSVSLVVPASAKGSYSFVAILPTQHEDVVSNIVKLQVE